MLFIRAGWLPPQSCVAKEKQVMGSWHLGEHKQVLFKIMKGNGEKSSSPGCLALGGP